MAYLEGSVSDFNVARPGYAIFLQWREESGVLPNYHPLFPRPASIQCRTVHDMRGTEGSHVNIELDLRTPSFHGLHGSCFLACLDRKLPVGTTYTHGSHSHSHSHPC
jgi:hypothetical protein